MSTLCRAAFAGFLLAVVAPSSKAADWKADLEKIQGTWIRVSTDGVKAKTPVMMVVTKAPEGNAVFVCEWKSKGQKKAVSSERARLDPTTTPRTLDFFPGDKNAPDVCPGIYKLEADTLTICFSIEGKRPTELVAGKNGNTLDVYRRVTKP